MIEPKVVKPNDFKKIVHKSSLTLPGYVVWPSGSEDHILYGALPFLCPRWPIPKSLIDELELGDTLSCDNGAGEMWEARVVFKDGSLPPGLMALIKQLVVLASRQQNCTCRGAGSE
jgi:hypothetical protein